MTILDGRVAVITGAGRGIGREHALLFASLGAKVVVNDAGTAPDGSGGDVSAAELVVQEIIEAGGEAVANTDSVSDFTAAGRIVAQAPDAFGDLHVLVNNAGILRDRMIASMSEEEFDAVVSVHLKGTFNTMRHAADYWRARSKEGVKVDRAIVNTSSGSGLYGNPGQANYAAAKAGVASMTLVSAMELKRYGVRANCIAPIARTRLTASAGVVDQLDDPLFDPANVSPLVAVLAAADCPFTGQMFAVFGGVVAQLAGWATVEEVCSPDRWTAPALAEAMSRLPRTVEVRRSLPFGQSVA